MKTKVLKISAKVSQSELFQKGGILNYRFERGASHILPTTYICVRGNTNSAIYGTHEIYDAGEIYKSKFVESKYNPFK